MILETISGIYFLGLVFSTLLYISFAVKERSGFNFDFTDVGDIAFTSIFWFISLPFILSNVRVVNKRNGK